MNQHKPHRRLLAMGLALVMALGTTPVSVSAYTATENGGEIIAFEALPEGTTNQTVPLGKSLSDLDLPGTLNATVRVATATDADEPVQDSGQPEQEQPAPEAQQEETDVPDGAANAAEDEKVPAGDEQQTGTPSNAQGAAAGDEDGSLQIQTSTGSAIALGDSGTEPDEDDDQPDYMDMDIPVPVEWVSAPDYDGETAGIYTFTAKITGFIVSADLPSITVTVGTPAGVVTAFDALDEIVAVQSVALGTPLSGIALPLSLSATVDGEEADVPVTWTSAPEYIPGGEDEEPGEYLFTPQLGNGYTLAESVSLPTITVTTGLMLLRGAAATITNWNQVQAALDDGASVLDLSSLSTPAEVYTFNVGDGKTLTLKGTAGTTIENVAFVFGANNSITIENLNIKSADNHADTVTEQKGHSPLYFTGTGNTLTLVGENTITSGQTGFANYYGAAVGVPSGAALTITAKDSVGKLTATGGEGGAGIGGVSNRSGGGDGAGGSITINDGEITATGGEDGAGIGGGYNGNGGSITINDGEITATGGEDGAGIGGGVYGAGGTITINDGEITANGGYSGAGIGGGENGDGGSITITGGTIEVKSGNYGSGIGGGSYGNGGTIAINGGTVSAEGWGTSGQSGAGIGGGENGDGGSITITGGTVKVKSGNYGAGIGGGYKGAGGTVVITGGSVDTSASGTNGENIGKGYGGSSSGSLKDSNDNDIYLNTLTITSKGNTAVSSASYGTSGSYGTDDVQTDDSGKLYFYLPTSGDVEDVLVTMVGEVYSANYQREENHDNAQTLTLNPWENVRTEIDNAKSGAVIDLSGLVTPANNKVYTFTVGDGKTLTLKGGDTMPTNPIKNVAFVFGSNNNITIENLDIKSADAHADSSDSNKKGYSPLHFTGAGNTLTLVGNNTVTSGQTGFANYYGAAVGVPSGAALTITDTSKGSLTTTGGYGAGIGGGHFGGAGGNITINGGTVTAKGGGTAAGIGGGNVGNGGSITINGGTVTANGGFYGAGIGGGSWGTGGTIAINGGKIQAKGGHFGGAGIGGGGNGGAGGTITISGGTVTASGGAGSDNAGSGAGIGGGGKSDVTPGGDGGTVVISGGSVKVTGGAGAEDIGMGEGGANSGTLTDGTNPIYLNTLTRSGLTNTAIASASYGTSGSYGTDDVQTDDSGKLYFYLPVSGENETVEVTADGIGYIAEYTRKNSHTNTAHLGLSLKSAVIEITGSLAYTGTVVAPEITVKLDGKTLLKGTEYAINYVGDCTNVGTTTAKIVIIGQGTYAGKVEKTFTITAKSLTESMISVENATYNGEPQTPTVTVKDGTQTLVLNTDYTVKYSNNTNAGTATVTVTGKGNYGGEASKSFTITAKTLTNAMLSVSDVTYNGKPQTPTVTVKDGTQTLVLNTDYTVKYSDNTNAGTATVTVTGKGNYSGEASKSFTITAITLTDDMLSVSDVTYNGSAQTPAITVKHGETLLVREKDYTVEYSNNTNAGTATVTVAGQGNYSGTANKTFTIAKAEQPIEIKQVTGKKFKDSAFALEITGGKGTGAVTYSVPNSDVLSITDATATIQDAGTVIVTAIKAADDNYNSALATLEITIAKADAPNISYPSASAITYGQKLSASGLTGGSIEYGTFAWKEGETVPTVQNTGYLVTFTPSAETIKNYEAITDTTKTVSVTVSKATPAITVKAEVSGDTGSRQVVLTATVTGMTNGETPTGTVKFVNTTGGTDADISDATSVSLTNGTAAFTWTGLAEQIYNVKTVYSGSNNYDTATSAEASFDTSKKNQAALSIGDIGEKTYGDGSFALTTTGGSGTGAVTFASSDSDVLSISGNTATIHKAGAVTITATKAQDSTYNEARVSIPVTIGKKSLTVTADDKLNIIKGSAMPELTFAVSGLVSGDTFTQPIISTTAVDTNTVGEYPISISDGILNNADDYTVTYQNGKLTVVNQTYAVTVNNGTGGGSYGENQLVTITANNRPGYTFTNWSSADGVSFADSKASTTTFTMPGKAVTITANYSTNSGGNGGSSDGGSSSGGSTTTPATTSPGKAPNQPVTAAAPVTATAGKNGTASVEIPEKSITDAIAKAQADAKAQGKPASGIGVSVNVSVPKASKSLTLVLTQPVLKRLVDGKVQQFEVNGQILTLSLDQKALAEIQKQSTGNVTIALKPTTAKGVRNAYNITLSYVKDGKTVNITSLGTGSATISIPCTPGKNEATGYLYAVYVDGKGKINRIAGSAYDANSGSVIFSTNHFSVYGVGYTAPSAKFTDINTHWAKESIDYVVGRGLLSGTAETTFAPDTAMTRGMLVSALGRLANVDTKAYPTNSFTDVKADSAFRPYIEWAYKKGIVQGTGNGKFEPDRAITREEIAVIFSNYAKATGYTLPVTRTATTYADASSIGSTYKTAVTAMQQAGVMMGEQNNKFNPKASATRAEVSSMLHRYIKLTIDPATAQGWAKNDDGQYLYYKDGKAVTGTHTIDGVKYYFNDNGTLKTGWVKDDAGNWHFYSGNTMLVGFWDLGANGNNKTYYFNKDGIMVAGKWLEIDGKWYYFNADGSLAKSTKIDGYEVDENGVRKTK